jgi:hypothetical protein
MSTREAKSFLESARAQVNANPANSLSSKELWKRTTTIPFVLFLLHSDVGRSISTHKSCMFVGINTRILTPTGPSSQ